MPYLVIRKDIEILDYKYKLLTNLDLVSKYTRISHNTLKDPFSRDKKLVYHKGIFTIIKLKSNESEFNPVIELAEKLMGIYGESVGEVAYDEDLKDSKYVQCILTMPFGIFKSKAKDKKVAKEKASIEALNFIFKNNL